MKRKTELNFQGFDMSLQQLDWRRIFKRILTWTETNAAT
jgi:hypothetical protein